MKREKWRKLEENGGERLRKRSYQHFQFSACSGSHWFHFSEPPPPPQQKAHHSIALVEHWDPSICSEKMAKRKQRIRR